MLLSFVGSIVLAQAAKTVDLEIKGMRADYAVVALGKAAGVDLKARAALKDTTVALRLHGVALEEAKTRLAKALNATWVKDGATEYLDRPELTPQKRAEVRGRFAATSIRTFLRDFPLLQSIDAQTLKELDAALSGPRPRGDDEKGLKRFYELQQQFQMNNPEQRMMVALAKAVGPERIGQIPPGERVVYSLRPTNKQLPLPASMASIATDWMREEKVYLDYITSRPETPGGIDNYNMYKYRYRDNKVPAASEMSDLWFTVESKRDSVTMWVSAFKTDGEGPFQSSTSMNIGYDRVVDDKEPDKPVEVDAKYKPSPRADFGHRVSQNWTTIKLDRNKLLRDLPSFADESQGDALLAFEAEAFDGWAAAKGLNMVAVLPERPAGGYSSGDEGVDVSSVVTDVMSHHRARAEEKDGWLTVVPTDPLAERAVRAARQEFFFLIDRGLRNGKLTLDDMADVASRLDDGEYQRTFNNAARVLGRPAQSGGEMMDIRALRMYGLLDANNRKRVMAGEKVEINPFLSGGFARESERIVYRTIFRVTPPDYSYIEFGKEDDLGWMTGQTWAGGRKSEATFALGNGLPQATRVVFQLSPLVAVQTRRAEESDWDWQDVRLLDSFIRERVTMRSVAAQYEKENIAAIVPMTRLGVKFDFGDKSWGMVNMIWPDDYRLPSFGSPSSIIAAYPDKYQSELKKQGGG